MSTAQLTCPHCRTVIQVHVYPYTTTVMCTKCGKYFGKDQGHTLVSTAIFDKINSPSNVPSQGVAYPLVSPAYTPTHSVSYPPVQSLNSSVQSQSHASPYVTSSSSTPSISNYPPTNTHSSSQYPLMNSSAPLPSSSSMYNYASSLPKNSPAFVAHSSAPPPNVQYSYLSGVNVVPPQTPSTVPPSHPPFQASQYPSSNPTISQIQNPTAPVQHSMAVPQYVQQAPSTNDPFAIGHAPPSVLPAPMEPSIPNDFALPSAPPLNASAEIEQFSPPQQKMQTPAVPEHLLQPHPTFICPITQDVMEHPVVATDGFTYEKSAIEQWLHNHKTSPMTNQALSSKQLIPNLNLRSQIIEWQEQRRKYNIA